MRGIGKGLSAGHNGAVDLLVGDFFRRAGNRELFEVQ